MFLFLKDLILTKGLSLQHLNQRLEQVLSGGNSDQVLLAIQVDQVLSAEWSIKAHLGNKIPVLEFNLVSKWLHKLLKWVTKQLLVTLYNRSLATITNQIQN